MSFIFLPLGLFLTIQSLGVDAVKDKVDEKTSEFSKESNKQTAENEAKGIVETAKEKATDAYVISIS